MTPLNYVTDTIFLAEKNKTINKHQHLFYYSCSSIWPFSPIQATLMKEKEQLQEIVLWNLYTLMETVFYAPLVQTTRNEELVMLLRNSLTLALKNWKQSTHYSSTVFLGQECNHWRAINIVTCHWLKHIPMLVWFRKLIGQMVVVVQERIWWGFCGSALLKTSYW